MAKRKSTRKSVAKKAAATVRLRAMHSTAAIAKGNTHYPVQPDGTIEVPASEVRDFLKMGCSRLK